MKFELFGLCCGFIWFDFDVFVLVVNVFVFVGFRFLISLNFCCELIDFLFVVIFYDDVCLIGICYIEIGRYGFLDFVGEVNL